MQIVRVRPVHLSALGGGRSATTAVITNVNPRTFQAGDAHRLDDPQRLLWMPPYEVVDRLDLKPGMVVADIGAGNGFLAMPPRNRSTSRRSVRAIPPLRECLSPGTL